MNKSIRYLLISASIAAVSQAAPFMAVGDGAELFATGMLGMRADDNIFLDQSKISDLIVDVTPGLELDFGKNAQMQGSVTVADDFGFFTDHSNLNTNLFGADFISNYDDGKMKLGLNAGYHELNQNTADVRAVNGRLIRRDVTSGGLNAEVVVSEITSVGGAAMYSHENYHPAGYVDSDTITIPVDLYYKWTPKVDLSLGYQYRNYRVNSGSALDSNDNFFNVGARGEFSPKLTGKFAVGYTQRHFSSGNQSNASLPGVDASFAYELSPKTSLQVGASNDFGTSPQGAQQKNSTINGLVTTKLTEEWSLNAGLSYRGIRYYGSNTAADRTDHYWEATFGGSYIISANIKLLAAYVYRSYRSDIGSSVFDNNVFSIAANFRY